MHLACVLVGILCTLWLVGCAGDCANIMQRKFTDIGAACSRSQAAPYGTYWTLVLAAQGQ
jgi:uncharacterized protein YkwD